VDEPPLFSKNLDELLPPDPAAGSGGGAPAARPRPPAGPPPRTAGPRWAPTRWWQFGLAGGLVLSYATAIKFVRAARGGDAPDADWGELPGFAAAVFGAGFLCGVIVWAGRGLYRHIGPAGDAVVGLAVMVAFFASVMLVSEPELLDEKFATGGGPMLGFAAVIGPIAGVWIGRDLRRVPARRGPGG
jgi:hypothetical protein